MSGFVVIHRPNSRSDIQHMFSTIKHRGPHVAGIFESKYVAMAKII